MFFCTNRKVNVAKVHTRCIKPLSKEPYGVKDSETTTLDVTRTSTSKVCTARGRTSVYPPLDMCGRSRGGTPTFRDAIAWSGMARTGVRVGGCCLDHAVDSIF